MRIKWILTTFLASTLAARATAPLRGADRLRELVLFPGFNLNCYFGLSLQGNDYVIIHDIDYQNQVGLVQDTIKKQPDDMKQQLRLANLLYRAGRTNEARSCYQKVEQFCQKKAVTSPQDGLNLDNLGVALWGLGDREQAERTFRNAVLVSSNDWRCWVGLGNFLTDEFRSVLFPENLRSQIYPSQPPPKEELDWHPSGEVLAHAESLYFSSFDEQYQAIQRLAQDPKNQDARVTYWRECMLNTAIANGLIGTREGNDAAKYCIDLVLKSYPDDKQAKDILDALN